MPLYKIIFEHESKSHRFTYNGTTVHFQERRPSGSYKTLKSMTLDQFLDWKLANDYDNELIEVNPYASIRSR
jgi:hypothetical protein